MSNERVIFSLLIGNDAKHRESIVEIIELEGWKLYEAYVDLDDENGICVGLIEYPLLAAGLTSDGEGLVPIAAPSISTIDLLEGWNNINMAMVDPSGKCYNHDTTFDNAEEFLAFQVKREKRSRELAAERAARKKAS